MFRYILVILLINLNYFSYSQAYLGISFKDSQIKLNNRNPSFTFLLVTDVINNSPAEMAGILKNDIIASLNNKDILSAEDFKIKISKLSPKDTVTLLIQRSNSSFYKKLVLGSPPPFSDLTIGNQTNNLSNYERFENEFKLSNDPSKKLEYLEKMEMIIKKLNASQEQKQKVLADFNLVKKKLQDMIEAKFITDKSVNNQIMFIPGTFNLVERCTDCRSKGYEINKKSDRCYNCFQWSLSRKEFDFCQLCNNTRSINVTEYKVKCNFVMVAGPEVEKCLTLFKELINNYLEDLSKYDAKKNKHLLGIKDKLFLVYNNEATRLRFNIGNDLWYSHHLILDADGTAYYNESGWQPKYTFSGNWNISNGKLYIYVPNINIDGIDIKNYQLIQNRKR